MNVDRRLRVLFFGELSSTFSLLHYVALQKHPKSHVVLWVSSPVAGESAGRRAVFSSLSDAAERLALRASLEYQTLRRLRAPLAYVSLRAPRSRISKMRHDEDLCAELQELKPDLLVSAGFRQIVPPTILDIPRLGAFNCHPSLLPRFAGSNPWFWILSRGEVETAVTVHRMVEEVDAGNIVAQKKFPIDFNSNHQDLYNRSSLHSAMLLQECVELWTQGNWSERPQDQMQRTYYSAPHTRDYQIDWTGTKQDILNLVRAAAPAPGAWTTIRGQKLVIRRCVSDDGVSADPGTVVRIAPSGFVVACADGAIRVVSAVAERVQIGVGRLGHMPDISVGDCFSSRDEMRS